jgi:sporulation protein YlmC with PRC-barrel domain
MAPVPADALDWEGRTVLDRAGEKIGRIEEIFLVEETGEPEWALVKLGRRKGRTTLVPLTRAHSVEKGVAVDVTKDVVSEAPAVTPDNELGEGEVVKLYRHYGIDLPAVSDAAEPASGNGAPSLPQAAVQHHDSRPPEPAPEAVNGKADPRDESVGDLLKAVKEEGSTLVGQEVRLAKAEMAGKVKDVGIGAGMFGGAGYVAHLASLALMLTLIFALAEAMAPWLAALIVTVLYGALAAGLALLAKQRLQQAGAPIPEQAIESVKQTIQTVKEEATWGLGQTKR